MERSVAIPCVVSARALWSAPYAPALIRVGPTTQKLVWAHRKDLVLDAQSPAEEELSATLLAQLLREEGDAVVVSLRTRGLPTELAISKVVFKTLEASA